MSDLTAVFSGGFDRSKAPEDTKFALIPKGKQLIVITDSEVKETKARDGKYLKLVHEVIDGPYKGRKIFVNLNIANKSKETEDIAHRKLASLQDAVGFKGMLTDSAVLRNVPVIADVTISKSGDQNDVAAYSSATNQRPAVVGGTASPKPQAVQQAASTGQNSSTTSPSSDNTPPWKRK